MIADPSRAAILDCLMDGGARSVGELAREARISRSTTSEHVSLLEQAELVTAERAGRHRLVRLRDATVARTLEQLANLAGMSFSAANSTAIARLRSARTCYDHLAGRLGVGLADALVERGMLVRGEEAFAVARRGGAWFAAIGIDIDELTAGRRDLARACPDWTERRPHLAGGLGSSLARRAFELGWVVRLAGTRAVLVTPEGRAFLEGAFGLRGAWARPGHPPPRAMASGNDAATIPGSRESPGMDNRRPEGNAAH